MIVPVITRQANKIWEACNTLIKPNECNILQLAKVKGLLVASLPGVKMGKLYYKRLDNCQTHALKEKAGNNKALMKVTPDMKDLNWWLNNIPQSFNNIVDPKSCLLTLWS